MLQTSSNRSEETLARGRTQEIVHLLVGAARQTPVEHLLHVVALIRLGDAHVVAVGHQLAGLALPEQLVVRLEEQLHVGLLDVVVPVPVQ